MKIVILRIFFALCLCGCGVVLSEGESLLDVEEALTFWIAEAGLRSEELASIGARRVI